ncbi:MAG: permease-like cell division protein FtsX [Methylovulum sp.]|jgi:cell division transport system permease protein|nr:permease-like cell division protein FtsX [Methylovulum sp.]MCF7998184.1 permease-like cell division protein FtsX [Methylovulum sp.]
MKPKYRRHQTREVKQPRYTRDAKQDIKRTAAAGGSLRDKLKAYRDLHAHALFSSLGRLVSSPFNTIMTVVVLSIAISLAGGFYLVLKNLQQFTGNLETSAQISLFLKDEITEAHAKQLAENIRQNPAIQSVKLITKEQALAEFKTYSGFGSAISVLKTNPLPIVVQVLPRDTLENKEGFEELLQTFQQSVEVDSAQFDLKWVQRLQSIMAVSQRGAALLNLMLGVAVIFIAGNTIRLELNNRREEVIIAKLVGATSAFIQRPFLYTGFWIGFLSGVTSWFTVTMMMLILMQPVEHLSTLYGGNFHLLFFGFLDTLELLAISSGLGVLGSWAVLMHQLRLTKVM